ncbi:HD domain-containing protein [bacterium]|nr:HD domain-containing protein [bacterium]
MIIHEKEQYDFYGLVLDFTMATHDTYPVIISLNSMDRVVVRVPLDTIVEKGKIYHIVGTGEQYKTKIHIYTKEFKLLNDIDNLTQEEKDEITNKILGNTLIDTKAVINYLDEKVSSIENKVLKDITENILLRYKTKFIEYPAATKFHHAYKSGLLYHTYNCLRLALSYTKIYSNINTDLIISGVILHDIMKIKEIKAFENEYSIEGKLIGHVSLSSQEIEKTAYMLGYDGQEEVLLLKHIVLSHHENPEYGSPKRPQILEALIIHLADMADAKIQPTIEALERAKIGELTEPIYVNERDKFYKHKLTK